ncbi:methyltransferase [Streptomyces sp. MMG1533]|uniref:SCO2525 family SAM-dependent methyltransferase n=1 Tax=Streptomyces sp. MMG1533 TaxID=1415546 RepID=UPI0006AEA86E|nr:SCO2525 family SAM-dependent methyltransferase [Streptomyces sp. MMG1533]KOU60242.1 methyltransferase [Streptomyces sp. MMG1533]
MTPGSSGDAQLNADFAWAAFDPIAYVHHNYLVMQAEDEEILRIVREHFGDHFQGRAGGPVSGVDVGAGANLYPALTMLPWCDEITLFERSPANVEYLVSQAKGSDANWDQFWHVLCEDGAYYALDMDQREKFRRVVSVEQGCIFDLDRYEARWSMGTMFFVAESMTASQQEFALGVERFLGVLAPGAPFVAAFMEHSKGYQVGEQFFPACDVGETEVRASLDPFAEDLKVECLRSSATVREGYSGMIVAYGRRRN